MAPTTNTQSAETGGRSSVQSQGGSLPTWKPSLRMQMKDFALVLTRRLSLVSESDP